LFNENQVKCFEFLKKYNLFFVDDYNQICKELAQNNSDLSVDLIKYFEENSASLSKKDKKLYEMIDLKIKSQQID
jgi:hypothetical protein